MVPVPLGPSPALGPRNGVRPNAMGERLASRVGNTPLLRLESLSREVAPVQILAKAEWFNPGGSVKDRAALSIIEDARRRGLLARGGTLLDASSGNTGIAYAWIGAALGLRVELAMPASATLERKKILRALGVELILTDPAEGSDGAILEARRRHQADPQRAYYADQYSNPANWRAHEQSTAPEIYRQTAGAVSHFVAGLGTSGTFVGTGRGLRALDPGIRLISVQPDMPLHGIEGLKHMESAIQPPIYDPHLADQSRLVTTEDSYRMVRRLARDEGILVGVSGAAAAACALEVARELREGVVVTVFPDSGERYLSEAFWEEVS